MSNTSPTAAEHEPASGSAPLRWSLDRRLEFLDFRLRWEGRINRGDLTSFFGISIPQATNDIREYLRRAPANASYDHRSRVYIAGQEFEPLFPSNEPARYLNELLARMNGVLPSELSFLGWTPSTVTVPAPVRRLRPAVVIAVLTAIRQRVCLKVVYQSMSKTEPTVRMLAPHGIGFDGFRWHVRAYCHLRHEFRDFVLARILDIHLIEELGTDGSGDAAWHQVVRLVLAPNSRLPKAARRAIELDYGMDNGEVALECRQAVLFYALKRLGLLEADGASPHSQQIVLRNRAAVMKFLPPSDTLPA